MKWECVLCNKTPDKGWYYIASTDDNIDYFYCDDCVPRGCSCRKELKNDIDINSKEAKDPKSYHDRLDASGRKLPCVEFSFVDNDFEIKQRLG